MKVSLTRTAIDTLQLRLAEEMAGYVILSEMIKRMHELGTMQNEMFEAMDMIAHWSGRFEARMEDAAIIFGQEKAEKMLEQMRARAVKGLPEHIKESDERELRDLLEEFVSMSMQQQGDIDIMDEPTAEAAASAMADKAMAAAGQAAAADEK